MLHFCIVLFYFSGHKFYQLMWLFTVSYFLLKKNSIYFQIETLSSSYNICNEKNHSIFRQHIVYIVSIRKGTMMLHLIIYHVSSENSEMHSTDRCSISGVSCRYICLFYTYTYSTPVRLHPGWLWIAKIILLYTVVLVMLFLLPYVSVHTGVMHSNVHNSVSVRRKWGLGVIKHL